MGKVAVVTGANTGIGKETARGLVERGFVVVLAVRDVVKGEAARADILGTTAAPPDDVVVLPLDQADTASIRAFAKAFAERFDRLDLLVANAGVWTRERGTTKDGFELTFGVNHLGTFLLVHELSPMLERSAPSRVVVVSSDLHHRGKMDWDDLQFERKKYRGIAAYNQSKLAGVLFAKALARRLEDKGVRVNAVHPGVVATELTRELPRPLRAIWNFFLLTPEEGAKTSLHVALSDEGAEKTGAYFEKSRERPPARAALDEAAQEKLWSVSERLLGLAAAP